LNLNKESFKEKPLRILSVSVKNRAPNRGRAISCVSDARNVSKAIFVERHSAVTDVDHVHGLLNTHEHESDTDTIDATLKYLPFSVQSKSIIFIQIAFVAAANVLSIENAQFHLFG